MVGRTRWWSRSRGLPAQAYAAWAGSLPGGRSDRILAWAQAGDELVVAGVAGLAVGAETWEHTGWHEIERGGWDAETRTLVWWGYASQTNGPARREVALAEPGRVPEVFQERVAASIAVRSFVALQGERGVTVTARRDLGAGGLHWHTTLTRGLTLAMPGVADAVGDALTAVRTEYDPG